MGCIIWVEIDNTKNNTDIRIVELLDNFFMNSKKNDCRKQDYINLV